MTADNPGNSPWQLWIDTGGTFTDCVCLSPAGDIRRLKVLSNSVLRGRIIAQPDQRTVQIEIAWPLTQDIFKGFEFLVPGLFASSIRSVDTAKGLVHLSDPIRKVVRGTSIEITSNEEVPVLAARLLTGTPLTQEFPAIEMKLGSTRGTNAILERKGAKTALLITKGFKDLLLIGNQQRPDLFALQVVKPQPLYDLVFEVNERMEADGSILSPLSQANIATLAVGLKKKKISSVAIALMNAYKNPSHEKMLATGLREAGISHVSASHELSGQIGILSRTETTVANAYLDPIIQTYVAGIQGGLSDARLSVMTSAGSVVRSSSFFPKDSLLSGPAGGVVGAAKQASRSGVKKFLAFDMGGTSTDVSMYNERFDYRFESRVGDFKILSPALAIETIASGGGSICDYDGYRFTVGPRSAGAVPGPACYGSGGPLTITDVNLLLGRLDPAAFTIPIYPEKSAQALDQLLKKTKGAVKKSQRAHVLGSLVQIANEKMAEAIKKISVQQGHDPREFSLLSFGGAGGQHACTLADILEMKHVLVPYDAGLLSAYGIGHADVERFEERLILQPWKKFGSSLNKTIDELYEKAKSSLEKEGYSKEKITRKKTLIFLRFAGQDASLEISLQPGQDILESFKEKYISIFGHWIDRDVEVESVKVIASVDQLLEPRDGPKPGSYVPKASKTQRITSHGKQVKGSVFRWEDLRPGAVLNGPALLISNNSTLFIDVSWECSLDQHLTAHLIRKKKMSVENVHAREAQLELFTNRFTAVAQEMGALLQRTSFSVNVKERLDFSCALLDPGGNLVVNAPHIPVHLGSLGVCVRAVSCALAMREGDVIVTNHPAFGGSHLPDVTVIKPVFHRKRLVGFVANRAHHAEIGGKKPGSMPADATTLVEEGVIIAPMYLVKSGKPRWEDLRKLLSEAVYPTRALEENLADLNGALAAVNLGEKELITLCEVYGQKEVVSQMRALREHASSLMKEKIRSLKKNIFIATERLDDGSVLSVRVTRKGGKLKIDLEGTAAVHPGNLNATRAIVQSVVLYTLRLLVNHPLPMNEGLMEPVEVMIPQGLLNPDFAKEPLPAVVGGNTEVSQRLTDTLLKAFGLAACSQGTMNNFLFGNERFGYYETICGGTGAGPGFNGTSAVHHHMTNTRITDPEVLEFRYPVRLNRFEIRKNSGGRGKWKGGDGVEREFVFKETLEISLLSQHRKEKPYGAKGGTAGKTGSQMLVRKDGTKENLSGMDGAVVNAGDCFIIQTPGGGGWGNS